MADHKITVKNAWMNWVIGYIDDFEFEANVYDEGSQFGIDNGRVSKLAVYRNNPRGEVISYDRGWDTYPATPELEDLLDSLLRFFKSLPLLDIWKQTLKTERQYLITDDFVLEYDEHGNPC